MRIDAYNNIAQLYQANSVSPVKKTTGGASFKDKLEISQTAKTYQAAKTAVADAPDVRMDKVMQIKAQMQAGTYRVSSEAIADKILGQAQTITF